MKITKEKLRKFNACTGGYKWFLEQYPDGNADAWDAASAAMMEKILRNGLEILEK